MPPSTSLLDNVHTAPACSIGARIHVERSSAWSTINLSVVVCCFSATTIYMALCVLDGGSTLVLRQTAFRSRNVVSEEKLFKIDVRVQSSKGDTAAAQRDEMPPSGHQRIPHIAAHTGEHHNSSMHHAPSR